MFSSFLALRSLKCQVSLQVLTFSDPLAPPALLSADHIFSSETEFPLGHLFQNVSWTECGPLRHGKFVLGQEQIVGLEQP